MPKIIENLQERLVAEAWKQITESGYSNMTIRTVAAGCGIGVGTVYNYFQSKDELLAACMMDDWKSCVAEIEKVSERSEDPRLVLRTMYDQLRLFAGRNQTVFQDPAAAMGFTGAFNRYHKILQSHLSQPLRKFCDGEFAADFIAEALLTWTMARKNFEEIYEMIGKLFK